MMASTERLVSGVCWSGHNIWYTESLIAGKVAGARGGRGGCSLAPESERPPVTTVRAQLVGVHCLQRLGPGTEPSTAEDDSWQLSWPATSCHPSVSIIHTCISRFLHGGGPSPRIWVERISTKDIRGKVCFIRSDGWCHNNLDKSSRRDTHCMPCCIIRQAAGRSGAEMVSAAVKRVWLRNVNNAAGDWARAESS